MPFFDPKTGAMALKKGRFFTAHMPLSAALAALHGKKGRPAASETKAILPFPAVDAAGGRLAPIAFFEADRLSAVQLTVVAVGQKNKPTAQQQRSYLFSVFHCKDPSPDSQRNCRLATTFGSVTFFPDPRVGCAVARVAYR
jgi:hypothetical protein